ncbi:uracil-DNA glycosylase [Metabacillus litoralis]|uniref:uracil-DNA glycosylase n=1 Tax=Metabacillus TaxID=2675233 RepID=UPI000EF5D865|nr:uracil-DNA glycosylase [Metabacillus litoralis]MCM3411629.1 uracil-DNA glycosylase [Metabacillus litoralis]UHA61239.1 uracil-DNA glycosylase [Metabacillus litoralis]
MKLQMDKSWDSMLGEQFQSDYFKELLDFLREEYEQQTIFPERENIFRALNETPYDKVKAVILGQDPYHGEGQAQGLSFSVQPGVKLPPSLRNIYIELQDDINCSLPENGSLVKWAKEGVLLLNTVLTVRKGEPASHAKKGWEMFTDEIIKKLDQRNQPIVFILWGKHAQQKMQLINSSKHFVIESAHPSPFSARKGFFGSKPFSKTNDYLRSQNIEEIDWSL